MSIQEAVNKGMFAPRMWRCFSVPVEVRPHLSVCSTHVEMFLLCCPVEQHFVRLLHACGDVSEIADKNYQLQAFAPRMWRCFQTAADIARTEAVCSTHVEMFLQKAHGKVHWMSLLHACGDVSGAAWKNNQTNLFAPRMWRCFSR